MVLEDYDKQREILRILEDGLRSLKTRLNYKDFSQL
jgi:hypothetical protein